MGSEFSSPSQQPMENAVSDWYQLSSEDTLHQLESAVDTGLSQAEAARRLERDGPNRLVEKGIKSPWKVLWEQLTATLVVVLIVAAVISLMLGDIKDAVAILAIVVLNALLGFRQEYRAEKAMAALKRLAVPVVKVRREGHVHEVSAEELTKGDLVLLEAGGAVPADGRLVESANLRVMEAALTGESEPAEKRAEVVFAQTEAVADRNNMVFFGTSITFGRGTMVVTETGMDTELGHIAHMIQTVETEPTPLQKRLDYLGKMLAVIVLFIVSIVFFLGLWRTGWSDTEQVKILFLTAVSLAVAAIPEGLPAVVTIALAIGAQRMLRRNALIRKLPAVETLGSVTTICSDKTGTLTKNEMTLTVLDVAGRRVDVVERDGRHGVVSSVSDEDVSELHHHSSLAFLLVGGALCNDAVLERSDEGTDVRAVGDPTEGALVLAAARLGLDKGTLERTLSRIAEAPFDSDRKRMTTVHRVPGRLDQSPAAPLASWLEKAAAGKPLAFTKGAIDGLLDISTRVWNDGQIVPLDDAWRQRIMDAHDQVAQQGMRVLGVAFRSVEQPLEDLDVEAELEKDMTFIGLVGMIDPPRAEVPDAVATCKRAGIRPAMITGDHPLTARYIADQLGIDTNGGVLTGKELDELAADQFEEVVERVSVYARVSPQHKLDLVKSLQSRGEIVAMTGDGVNDAPALKQADIGVAMGDVGTDVAKEAADTVLRDDNFATIVAAVREGRIVYDNIRKFIKYTMTSNSGEIWVMLLAPFAWMDLPLLPLQILWINLVTDGLPGLALAVEPGERDTMDRPPYPPDEHVFSRGMGQHIFFVGLLMGLISLGAGFFYWNPEQPEDPYWRTMVFMVLTMSQMGHALATRSGRDSLFKIGLLSNKAMLGAVTLTFVLQLAVTYVGPLQDIFHTTGLTVRDLVISLLLSSVVFWCVEISKWWRARGRQNETVAAVSA